MSWLNLNESLSSIKGQISSFASGVLAEGIVEDTDPFTELSVANKRVQELQNVVSSQDVEIASLRRQNAELFEKIKFGEKSKNDGLQTSVANSNGEHCFWDPPASEENHVFGGDPSLAQRKNSTNSTVSDLTIRIENLEAEKRDLIHSLEQLDQDCQRTTDKLVTLKDNLQTDFNKLKNDFDFLKLENDALTKDNSKYRQELKKLADENISLKTINIKPQTIKPIHQEKLEELELKYKAILQEKQTLETNNNNLNKLQTDYDILKSELDAIRSKNASLNDVGAKYQSAENTIKKLTTEISLLQNSNVSDDFKKIQDQYQDLKTQFDQVQIDSQKMHKKYVNILTETFKKYVDYAIPDEFVLQQNETPEISEFNSKVEAVLKLLLDCKWKTETLERKLCEISHEKAVAVTEKNHEIEKLLHNSEILSQEVITKTQTINHYEMECSELIKNNDLLIQELQQYKTNNGLQTISESNEDNLLLLESQLEGANKRIKDLELIISDMENAKQDIALETQTELDYIKKQLNLTGKELSQSKKEYQDLLKAYKQFEMDNQNLNIELQKITTAYSTTLTEKQNLESLVERMKNDIENTEYKFVEANVEVDTMKEELQHAKMACANISNSISSSKKEMEDQIDIANKERDELKYCFEQYRNEVELNTRSLTEKLQNSKMSETVLKLQNDQIKKELETVSELKSNFDQKMQKYHQDFFEIINAFKDLKHSSYLLHETPIDDDNLTLLDKFVVLKRHFKLLEEKLAMSKNGDDCLEKKMESKLTELETEKLELLTVNQMLQNNFADVQSQMEILLKNQMELQNSLKNLQEEKLELQNKLQGEGGLESVQKHLESLKNKILILETDVHNLTAEKVELLNVVRSKHEENVQYHSEIQRLNIILSQETDKVKRLEDLHQNIPKVDENVHVMEEKLAEIEKLSDQNSFLKEKCEKLAQNLMEEQSNVQKVLNDRNSVSERELNLTKELERLRMHLVEIEDSYTQELLQAEQRSQEMMGKMNEIEQRERDSSTIYTSVSIRANQQVETLQNQLQLVTVQRDELQKKISEAEDKSNKQIAALTNLQCVLEQFQRDREKDIVQETERIRRQILVERQKQTELQEEINLLKSQLDESKQGLKAAARLTEQMEKSNSQVIEMKEEVSKLQDHLRNSENKYKILSNKTNATVDRSLIKNLVVGFIASNNNLTKDQQQILKIIATVLDFTPQDNDKLSAHKPAGGSWMSAILHPQVASNSSMSQQSLSEAFVRFLETESQPKPTPPLLNVRKMSVESNVSSSSSTKQTPILLNEVVLPTFADFAQNRNASSILKDVLKDN